MNERDSEWAKDQAYIDSLYRLVEREQTDAAETLRAALAERPEESDGMLRRETLVSHTRRRLATLRAADSGLCFGRMDGADSRLYLGRTGLFDDQHTDPLLLDWRAPAARPFYCATGRDPMGLIKRRHFRLEGKRIEQVSEECLDESHSADQALLTALENPRSATMRDIVGTIQADQDAIIREPAGGILIIEGGPGTGKTAVAMHRIAYLLYTEHDRLARRGVLMVGPNTRFLRYVSQVLPSLGETGVVFCTPGELYPGLLAEAPESESAHRIKGSHDMTAVLARAVADRQELPGEPVPVELDDVTAWLTESMCAHARAKARACGRKHNAAQPVFRESLLSALTDDAVGRIGADLLEPDDVLDVHHELAASPMFAAALDRLWPVLTPQQLLGELYTSSERTAAATPGWPETDRALLHRQGSPVWTVADAALLDEAAELLGEVEREQPPETDTGEAEAVLALLDNPDDADHPEGSEALRAADVVDPETLAARYAEPDTRSIAERAAHDRHWTFGHVVVDEAQELSAMQWRVLLRRCPIKSMTVAGDLAQTSGAQPWRSVFADEPVRVRTLHTNYRVPRPIMQLAGRVVPEASLPESYRDGEQPWSVRAEEIELGELIERERELAAPGTLAVITAHPLRVPSSEASVLTPTVAKGLEFDSVLVLEPAELTDPAELYVALTRATKRLGIVHTGPLPELLAGCQWVAARSTEAARRKR